MFFECMRLLLFLFIFYNNFNELYSQSKVNWVELKDNTSINNDGKKMLIDLYTGWCGWCKVMDQKTFTNKEVIDKINKNFLPIKFNAEYQKNVDFNDNTFKYVRSGRRGINELAYYLTNGNLSYPMTVFLDENYKLITLLPGYHKPDFYNLVLTYIGEDHWKDTNWDDFLKNKSK